jgi:glycerophosphoryl diester phosphodiesterase
MGNLCEINNDISTAIDSRNFDIISHRGNNSKNYKENTLRAFQQSIKDGIYLIELDVLITLDGKVIIKHDTINEETGELHYNSVYKNELQLDTVFKILPSTVNYIIDLKEVRPESNLIKNVLLICNKYNVLHRCLFGSFNEFLLEDLYSYERENNIKLKKAYISGNSDINYFNEVITSWDLSHLILYVNQISKELVDFLKNRYDINIYLYTCNSIGSYKYALKIGVDGIISDNPLKFK